MVDTSNIVSLSETCSTERAPASAGQIPLYPQHKVCRAFTGPLSAEHTSGINFVMRHMYDVAATEYLVVACNKPVSSLKLFLLPMARSTHCSQLASSSGVIE